MATLLNALHNDQLDWSLSAHRRGTLSGMDAAPELTRTYLQRVPRWWAGKGLAAKPQITRSATDALIASMPLASQSKLTVLQWLTSHTQKRRA
ncbi:hypothetical protein OR60_20645 [Xanthomonas vesicatoria]|uniref:Uncharacterized protein n=1 Tax=Xanthomonas vesicatoria TaxID=56460 RepID=A0AAJ0IWX4_9XANT|nr:hypothetical protein OR60_20645 [Xanthomonas vesicatoria]KHM93229.1 hypothetical protein OR61_14620 [Xanthomonas vesicatoria]